MPSIKTYLPRDTREQSRIPIPGRFSGVRRPGCQPISSVFPGSWPKNNKNSTEKKKEISQRSWPNTHRVANCCFCVFSGIHSPYIYFHIAIFISIHFIYLCNILCAHSFFARFGCRRCPFVLLICCRSIQSPHTIIMA